MAEDLNNPLNNPGAEPVGPDTTHRSEPPEQNDELSEFLEDIFETPSSPRAEQPIEDEPEAEEPEPVEVAEEEEPEPDLQRIALEKFNAHMDRVTQQAEQPEPEPASTSVTPEQFQRQWEARVQEHVDNGWMSAEYAALYPLEAAKEVYLFEIGSQLQSGVQQTQQYTQAEQERQKVASAHKQIDDAINAVAERGDAFGALSDAEVQKGFKEFLINDLNPQLGQINPDFLARQFYAYNQELVVDAMRKEVAKASPKSGPSAADLAAQEGSSSRAETSGPAPPEFADLLDGMAAARWYE